MSHAGKLPPGAMRAVYRHLGARSMDIIQGPARGLDNAVLRLGEGRVMIVTADPVSVIPAVGVRRSAWMSAHLIASDFTSAGVDPEFAVFTFNFPPAMSARDRDGYIAALGDECERLGVAIVAGHTGSYPGAGYTVVGGGVMFGGAPEDGYVTPSMAREGDVVLMTKHAAIEATASLATSFPEFTETAVGGKAARWARSLLSKCSTVADARMARGAGLRTAVTSMHDATEGGVLGALDEMSAAARKAFVVEAGKIPVPSEVRRICSAFGIDPVRTMGEGALLITCRPGLQKEVYEAFNGSGVDLTAIGRVYPGEGLLVDEGGRKAERYRESPDAYWSAYKRATAQRIR
ncbi:MAG: AIR synthase [Nitrososphaerota archaeon]|nr:AIR synthase [Nitrososphaerota archaeon]MDG6948282.1 AIR synthase [Nitrososphaerota archaeon]